MSANIPFEIQAEIIERVLPVKSLIRFRSVSKQWKSLIDSSEFINHHSVNQTHQQHLLVRYEEADEYKYLSVVDDDSFPHQKFSPYVSPIVRLVNHTWMLGCSHGLVCLYGHSKVLRHGLIVVWNPSIRKSVGIACSGGLFTTLGFGVCPKTFEPKIVKISLRDPKLKAEVYTISSGGWRSIPMNIHMPQNNIRFRNNQVLINGVIHWFVSDPESGYIVSFDLTSEEFGKIYLPENLAHEYSLSIFKLKESLVVVDDDEGSTTVCDVWMMIKNGDSNFSFEKLYTVRCCIHDDYDYDMCSIIGYTRNGQPIMEHYCTPNDSVITKLESYEPSTSCISDIGIYVNSESVFNITSYTESLLLLNHSDSIIKD